MQEFRKQSTGTTISVFSSLLPSHLPIYQTMLPTKQQHRAMLRGRPGGVPAVWWLASWRRPA